MGQEAPKRTKQAAGLEELNLVEFPLGVLSKQAPKGVKTLRFVDEVTDQIDR